MVHVVTHTCESLLFYITQSLQTFVLIAGVHQALFRPDRKSGALDPLQEGAKTGSVEARWGPGSVYRVKSPVSSSVRPWFRRGIRERNQPLFRGGRSQSTDGTGRSLQALVAPGLMAVSASDIPDPSVYQYWSLARFGVAWWADTIEKRERPQAIRERATEVGGDRGSHGVTGDGHPLETEVREQPIQIEYVIGEVIISTRGDVVALPVAPVVRHNHPIGPSKLVRHGSEGGSRVQESVEKEDGRPVFGTPRPVGQAESSMGPVGGRWLGQMISK